MALSSLEKWYGTLQHQSFEMLCLLMVDKRLLIGVLLVKQKFIWIVPGPIYGELQISGFPANFSGQLAQDFFDLPGLTITGTPVSYDHMCHFLPG
ncbi:MAG TPA: hypothetical protein VHT68_04860 [Pseudolabrys sp.]|nr:hypothetical protein [Pseudolabrys sp.]